jgi:hypothetical protein
MGKPKIINQPPKPYKEKIFYLWYNKGQPGGKALREILPVSDLDDYNLNQLPSVHTLYSWIRDDFIPRAYEMDRKVGDQLDHEMIKQKVEMLKRHAEVGTEMQNLALDHLRMYKDDLDSATAVRLLVRGVEIERDSRTIPKALEMMASKSDEELVAEVKKLIQSGEVVPLEGEEVSEVEDG